MINAYIATTISTLELTRKYIVQIINHHFHKCLTQTLWYKHFETCAGYTNLCVEFNMKFWYFSVVTKFHDCRSLVLFLSFFNGTVKNQSPNSELCRNAWSKCSSDNTACFASHWNQTYCQISNISRTKYQNLKVLRIFLQLTLPHPLKPCVKWGMKT